MAVYLNRTCRLTKQRPDTFIDDGIDDEDIEDVVEERKNEESMKQQVFSCFSTSIVISFNHSKRAEDGRRILRVR